VATNIIERQNSNFTVPMIQNQSQLPIQSNSMRHTITAGQSPNYVQVNQTVSNQSFNLRGSLPPNIVPPQYVNNSNYSNSSQTQSLRQNQQFIVQPQSQPIVMRPHIVPQQFIQGQQQVTRIPQHMPQSMVPGQKV